MARRMVVVGTGTDVGKTHVTCALLIALRARGVKLAITKPIATGTTSTLSEDMERLSRASGLPPRPAVFAYARPVSPHLAAREEGRPIDLDRIVQDAIDAERGHDLLVVETAGGLFSPLGPRTTNADIVRALAPSITLLVAPDRIGVLHDLTATTIAAASQSLRISAVALSAPAAADASTGTNAPEARTLGIAEHITSFPRAAPDRPASQSAASSLLTALSL